MCVFNFKFDLGLKILELEIKRNSQPEGLRIGSQAVSKVNSLERRLNKIDKMEDISERKKNKLK